MNDVECLQADYSGLGLTTGPHPMKMIRDRITDVWRAADLQKVTSGENGTHCRVGEPQSRVARWLNVFESYADGRGTEKDYAETVKWYRKAAEQNVARAQMDLGICYANGRG